MKNQVQLSAERIELLGKFKEAVPQFMAAEAEVIELAVPVQGANMIASD